MGKNGKEYTLTYRENFVIGSLLTLLLNKKVDFSDASDGECKEWASALRKNLDRIRLLYPARKFGGAFGLLEGMDRKRLFSIGLYASWSNQISNSQLEKAVVKQADESWREYITEFADFLDSCGGLVPFSENAYKYPEG
ncbi:MAG: hypothetical protein OK454_02200 [Thaumarchaeota archaeon]|nr:hypothetical protein [Nitrososphaerota archaeon]